MEDQDHVRKITEHLGPRLTDWQHRLLDELLDPAHKNEHLEWRFKRKIGYVQVWVPNA